MKVPVFPCYGEVNSVTDFLLEFHTCRIVRGRTEAQLLTVVMFVVLQGNPGCWWILSVDYEMRIMDVLRSRNQQTDDVFTKYSCSMQELMRLATPGRLRGVKKASSDSAVRAMVRCPHTQPRVPNVAKAAPRTTGN